MESYLQGGWHTGVITMATLTQRYTDSPDHDSLELLADDGKDNFPFRSLPTDLPLAGRGSGGCGQLP